MSHKEVSIVSLNAVTKSYGEFSVLNDVSFSIKQGERIGLVGANGSGKTTLLRIIAGLDQANAGRVTRKPDLTIGYIPQDFSAFLNDKVDEYLGHNPRSLAVFSEIQLSSSVLNRTLSELSGGEKTKLALAKILLASEDLILLDEPTNNLDIKALQYLERYVLNNQKTFIMVSHDAAFLDTVVNKIIELDQYSEGVRIYNGGFSDYMQEREARIGRQWKDYNDKLETLGKLKRSSEEKLEWAKVLERRRLANRTLNPKEKEKPDNSYLKDKEARLARKARIMKDRLERFDSHSDNIERPKEFLPLKVSFEVEERGGNRVFSLSEVKKKLPDHELGPLTLDIAYGDRILISGPNGSGKSTLLKLIMGEIKPDAGEIQIGSHVHIGYLPQEQYFLPNSSIVEEFQKHVDMEEGIARRLLNRFRLSKDDVHKAIRDLSAGERSRLVLAILMARKVNCLILDEPSNHLDQEVLVSLMSALKEFPGTIIAASHDRAFISEVGFDQDISLEA